MKNKENEKITAENKKPSVIAAKKTSDFEKQAEDLTGLENKEEVSDTLKELQIEKSKAAIRKRPLIFTVLMWLFFPVTIISLAVRKQMHKIKIPISIKMLIIYTIVFLAIMITFTAIYLTSIEQHLSEKAESVKYYRNLKITTTILLIVFTAVFMALVIVISSIMLNPIRKITERIDHITSDNLSQRLDIIDSQDELMELTERINEMLENIEESFIRQQNFVADASHELKTPIAVIQGYSNLLKRWGMNDPNILNEGIESISRESENMKRIVEQLLLLAKLGKMNMNKTQFNLYEVLDDMVDGYKIVNNTHKIIFDGDEEIELETDKNLLLECVRTLFDNAIKYTPSGGQVKVECYMQDGSCKIKVKDNGQGISEEDLPKIFDRFFRCDKARGRETGSSGLGLTIAKSIVDMIGGTINVSSKIGIGTEFIISLY